jgi:hypothetical protein
MLARLSPARRIVLVLVAIDVAAWSASGAAGRIPPASYVALDLGLEALIFVGLWFRWRAAWVTAVVLSVLGEVRFALYVKSHLAELVVGTIQLGLLLLPQMRREMKWPEQRSSKREPAR